MNRIPKGLAVLCLALLPALGSARGEEVPAERVRGTVTQAVDIRRETQEKKDRWEAEKAKLLARYEAAKSRVAELQGREAVWEKRVGLMEGRVKEFERRIAESDRLEASLQGVLEILLDRLEKSVDRDLPFLPEERRRRIRFLEETLARPEVSGAEKLRHLLEALQVECEYGDTVEVYDQRIEVDGKRISADIFRLGRISLFWRTPDGRRAGQYDRVSGRWVELPAKYRRGITLAMEMAAKRRPIELVRLPVGRIRP